MYVYQSYDGYWQVAQLTNSIYDIRKIVRTPKARAIMDGYYHNRHDAEIARREFVETMKS